MATERAKSPGRVQAGIRRQAHLREQLGEEGYRAYQRERRADALARHPDLQLRAAAAGNAAQYAAWGVNGYRAQRCAAYAAAVERHGHAVIHRHIRAAHEARRRHRLDHPTRGEALLRTAAIVLGFQVILPHTPFDYLAWLEDQTIWPEIDRCTAIAEATIGRYYCDLLFPTAAIAIEVLGGVHALQSDADARRRVDLARHGLTVVELHDTAAQPLQPADIERVLRDIPS